MASLLDIGNLALSKLGLSAMTSLADDSPRARAVVASLRTAIPKELRAHPWNFAIKRAQLAADPDQTLFGGRNVYPLPSDFLDIAPKDPEENSLCIDWQIEGRTIVTRDTSPLNIRYIANITDPNSYDALFVDVAACRVALDCTELLTNSRAKKDDLKDDYDRSVSTARLRNAIDNRPVQPPEDPFVTVRWS